MIDNDIRKCTGKYQIIHLSSNLININKTIKCGKITINHSNPRRNFTLVSEPHLGRPPPRPAPGQRPICPRWSSHWSGWTSARAAAPTHRHARSQEQQSTKNIINTTRPVTDMYRQCFGSRFGIRIRIQGLKKRLKMLNNHKIILLFSSVVDPDPHGSGTFAWIRNYSSGSGSSKK